MIKDFWFNLPVQNVTKSTRFFVEIGFTLNEQFNNSDTAASLFIGNKKQAKVQKFMQLFMKIVSLQLIY